MREIASDLGKSRYTVRKYVCSPDVPKRKPRAKHGAKLDGYKKYIDARLSEEFENRIVLHTAL